MSKEEILKWFHSDDSGSIYGYMYVAPYGYSIGDREVGWRRDSLVKIEKNKLQLYGNCFMFIWGWDRLDYSIYNFSDYGITWAFSETEIDLDYAMEKQENEWELVKNNHA